MILLYAYSLFTVYFSIHSTGKTLDGNNPIWMIAGIKKENKDTFPMMANF